MQFKAPNHKELKEFVFSKEEKYTEFDWSEDCDVKTILCTWQETLELFKPSVHEFANHIKKTFDWMSNEISKRGSNISRFTKS